jgi:hypothetical protein
MIVEYVFYDQMDDDLVVFAIHTGSWSFVDVELYYGYECIGVL